MTTSIRPVLPALSDQDALVLVLPQSWGKWTVTLGYVFEAVLIGIPCFMLFALIGIVTGIMKPPKDIQPSLPPDPSLDKKTEIVVDKNLNLI